MNNYPTVRTSQLSPSSQPPAPPSISPSPSSTMTDRPDCPSYKLVGDNIDKGVKVRYMRADKYHNKSLLYFHSYAVASRIDFSKFSNVKPATCLNSPPKRVLQLLQSSSKQFHYSGIKGACGKHSFL